MKRGLSRQREAIARKSEACAPCIQKCSMLYGKKDSSPVISFFKVMIGDQFSKVLFLPPKITSTMSAFVDKKIRLEDSNGQQWEVKVSNEDGSLAFIQGWEVFSLDHGLEVGDFAVFDYITGLRFDVKIYTNTCCEKLNFSGNNDRKKRTKTSKNSVVKDRQCHTNREHTMNVQSSGNDVEEEPLVTKNASSCKNKASTQPRTKLKSSEERNNITDKDLGGSQGEDIQAIYDLSNFEMQKNSGAKKRSKAAVGDESLHNPNTTPRFRAESKNTYKNPVAKLEPPRHLSTRSSFMRRENEENKSDMLDGATKKCHTDLGRDNAHSTKEGKKSKIIKREYVQDCFASDSVFVDKVVKPELFDYIQSSRLTVANFSCVVPKDRRSFLELPTSLFSFHHTARKTMIVYLRDQFMRLWPVLYIEGYNFKLLTKGWEAFSMVNNLQPGDKCTFEAEKEDTFRVHIAPK